MRVETIDSNDLEQWRSAGAVEDILLEAEREMAAFVTAVNHLFGCESARRAAEYWLEQLTRCGWTCDGISPNWRYFTVSASARLAVSVILDRSGAALDA
jgi:hypothetical protein